MQKLLNGTEEARKNLSGSCLLDQIELDWTVKVHSKVQQSAVTCTILQRLGKVCKRLCLLTQPLSWSVSFDCIITCRDASVWTWARNRHRCRVGVHLQFRLRNQKTVRIPRAVHHSAAKTTRLVGTWRNFFCPLRNPRVPVYNTVAFYARDSLLNCLA